jgi:hypothetical protein
VRSSGRRASALLAPASVLILAILLGGCAREAPEVREVRKTTQDYLHALARRDLKQIAERSTCLASTNSIVGGRVLKIEPARQVRMGTLDSLVRVSMADQRSADSSWARANDWNADSLFRRARVLSNRAGVYRNAARAVPVSFPGAVVARDSTVETRVVHARVRYAGPVIGPKPVDKEELLRLLRVRGGKWIVFSKYLVEDDPQPGMI